MATTARKKTRRTPDRGRLVLRLDSGIYTRKALRLAAEAFGGLAQIAISKSGKWHVVAFSKVDSSVAHNLVDEYSNFALGCMAVER